MRARKRVYFTGTAETPIEQQLYWVSYRPARAPVRVTETGWYNNAVMDKGATHALVTRSNTAQPSQTYLADASGKRLTWVEENALNAAHPYAPYLDSHVRPIFGSITGPDGSKLYYRMLSPPRVPGKRYPVYLLRLWRAARAAGDRRLVRRAAAPRGAGRPGLDRLHDRQSRDQPTAARSSKTRSIARMGDVEVTDQLAGVNG